MVTFDDIVFARKAKYCVTLVFESLVFAFFLSKTRKRVVFWQIRYNDYLKHFEIDIILQT